MEQEFLHIVNENQGILHKVSRTYADSEKDREDLFQDMVMHLWKAFPSFRAESKVSTWMYRIALNVAITGLRKRKRRPELSALDIALQVPVTTNDLEEEVALLYRAIRQLPQVERALVLLYLEDCSYEEIAEVLGITPNHVGVKLYRVRNKIRQILEPHLNP